MPKEMIMKTLIVVALLMAALAGCSGQDPGAYPDEEATPTGQS
jgi:predicted small lipoprotein YifL